MIKKITWILLLVIFNSCSGSYEITKIQDPSDPDATIYKTPRFAVQSKIGTEQINTYLQFICYEKNSEKIYSISSSYIGRDWPGFQKVTFLLGKNKEEIMPESPSAKSFDGIRGKIETITVHVPENTIINLYEFDETTMQVSGKEIKIDIYFTAPVKKQLQLFYEKTI